MTKRHFCSYHSKIKMNSYWLEKNILSFPSVLWWRMEEQVTKIGFKIPQVYINCNSLEEKDKRLKKLLWDVLLVMTMPWLVYFDVFLHHPLSTSMTTNKFLSSDSWCYLSSVLECTNSKMQRTKKPAGLISR